MANDVVDFKLEIPSKLNFIILMHNRCGHFDRFFFLALPSFQFFFLRLNILYLVFFMNIEEFV